MTGGMASLSHPMDLLRGGSRDQRMMHESTLSTYTSSEGEDPKEKVKRRQTKSSPPKKVRRSKCHRPLEQMSPSQASSKSQSVVYLLDKKAAGPAVVSDPNTQQTFLQLLGIVDNETKLPESELSCPTHEIFQILAVANCHNYSRRFQNVGETDGLYLTEKLDEMMEARERKIYMQCTCIAYKQLALDTPQNYKRGLWQLLRTAQPLQNNTGLHCPSAVRLLVWPSWKTKFCCTKVW